MNTKSKWVEVDVPRGAFYGWGNEPGQQLMGRVVHYDETGGTDFAKEVCPALEVVLLEPTDSYNKAGDRTAHEAGETIQLNCGQVSLRRAVTRAELEPGDLAKITLVNIAQIKGGRTVKEFSIAIIKAANVDGAEFGDDDEDDEPNF
ncbi:MAG: hypothetical protein ACLP9Y_27480 [Mycobacterium sp.]|uniref:hypothetical protein n=1 Tax=Mycobacterium sp. TaxID=1785 RepID=UPI003F9BF80A